MQHLVRAYNSLDPLLFHHIRSARRVHPTGVSILSHGYPVCGGAGRESTTCSKGYRRGRGNGANSQHPCIQGSTGREVHSNVLKAPMTRNAERTESIGKWEGRGIPLLSQNSPYPHILVRDRKELRASFQHSEFGSMTEGVRGFTAELSYLSCTASMLRHTTKPYPVRLPARCTIRQP